MHYVIINFSTVKPHVEFENVNGFAYRIPVGTFRAHRYSSIKGTRVGKQLFNIEIFQKQAITLNKPLIIPNSKEHLHQKTNFSDNTIPAARVGSSCSRFLQDVASECTAYRCKGNSNLGMFSPIQVDTYLPLRVFLPW